MDTSTPFVLTGVVPPVCDAEAGQEQPSFHQDLSTGSSCDGPELGTTEFLTTTRSSARHGFSMLRLRALMTELCIAVRSALDDERGTAEDSLRRAAEILDEIGATDAAPKAAVRGGLAPWQIRKVTNYVETHLDRPIKNEDIAAIVRLTPSHFGRAFRNSFGEPPHEYVIRRRVERAQGLMLSSNASLSDIALDCGLADQSHLTRLFRRIVGESPRAWRRARVSAPVVMRALQSAR
jgi:AraC family transcriptional regulator